MAEALVEARVDREVADRATTVLKKAGLSFSDAISPLLTRTANEGVLPFPLRMTQRNTIDGSALRCRKLSMIPGLLFRMER